MDENIITYNFNEKNTKAIFFVPGYTGGTSVKVIESLISFFSKEDYDVFGLTVDYLIDSMDLFDRSEFCIKGSIIQLTNTYPDKKIIVVAKSLGGSLVLHTINELPVEGLIILGNSVVLGWPQRISLLQDPVAVLPDYRAEWVKILEDVTKPVHIINGDSDDLVDNDFIKEITEKNSNLKLTVLPDINHNMENIITKEIPINQYVLIIQNSFNKV